jgi:hypothetical protein
MDKWMFLTQAANDNEADVMESVLDSEGIPVVRKYREAGGDLLKIYLGVTNFGVDIYVPADFAEKAAILLNEGSAEGFGEELEELEEEPEEEPEEPG